MTVEPIKLCKYFGNSRNIDHVEIILLKKKEYLVFYQAFLNVEVFQ